MEFDPDEAMRRLMAEWADRHDCSVDELVVEEERIDAALVLVGDGKAWTDEWVDFVCQAFGLSRGPNGIMHVPNDLRAWACLVVDDEDA